MKDTITIGSKITTKRGTFGVKEINFIPILDEPTIYRIEKCKIVDELKDHIYVVTHTNEKIFMSNIHGTVVEKPREYEKHI